MAKFIENPVKIYLKDSDKARLAVVRIRIVREYNPLEPCDNEDLVFKKVEDEHLIPANALMKWKFDFNNEREPIWFYTTAERCKQMVSDDPSWWTQEKLAWFAEEEKKRYQDWWDGNVYGYIIEKWDAAKREWMQISSIWGMYGAKSLFDNLVSKTDGVRIPICIDSKEMKYDFDNVEKKVNEFD